MYVRQLTLRDYRSWQLADLELTPGRTVLIGPNGFGKTNVLEALWYSATLSSHRVSSDAPLVHHGAPQAVISTIVVNDGRELAVDLEIAAGRANKARINRSPVRTPRQVLGILRAVMFAPEDLALVRGDPAERRRFLDDLLVQRRPRLAGVRADFDKVLRQRTALLKTAGAALRQKNDRSVLDTLEVWDGHLIQHGAELLAARTVLVSELRPRVEKAYQLLAPASRAADLAYRSSVGDVDANMSVEEIADALRLALAAKRSAEIERGVCLVGPHRDDVDLRLGNEPAKGFASHGESWSFALALRLAAFELLRTEGTDPLLLLDDVFAELDGTRRRALAAVAADVEQVIVTAAVPDDVPEELSARTITVDVCDDDEGRRSVMT